MANSHLSERKWKYVSIGLMAVLAVGFSFPQAFAAPVDNVLAIVQDIQAKVNSSTFGLQVIKTAVDSRASQTDVTAIKTKTDRLPNDPASSSDVVRLASRQLALKTLDLEEGEFNVAPTKDVKFSLTCDEPFALQSVMLYPHSDATLDSFEIHDGDIAIGISKVLITEDPISLVYPQKNVEITSKTGGPKGVPAETEFSVTVHQILHLEDDDTISGQAVVQVPNGATCNSTTEQVTP